MREDVVEVGGINGKRKFVDDDPKREDDMNVEDDADLKTGMLPLGCVVEMRVGAGACRRVAEAGAVGGAGATEGTEATAETEGAANGEVNSESGAARQSP